jgi:mono/diheme cytochrome c family protein
MVNITHKTLLVLAALVLLAVAGAAAFVWSGFYNVAADDPHTSPVHRLVETTRDRSIKTRAARLQVPTDLMLRERIVQGSGNYDAMCMGCHLAPGMDGTELSRGLYPAPPDLSRTTVAPAEAFWVIKHGIKASGMPAWGASMDDEYIWNMVAFLQALPGMDPDGYREAVSASDGHSHGGSESGAHEHGAGDHDGDHPHPAAAQEHPHPPGTSDDHHAPAARPRPAPAAPEPVAPAAPAASTHDAHDDDHGHHGH